MKITEENKVELKEASQSFFNVFKKLLKEIWTRIVQFNRQWNEAWLIVLGGVLWYYSDYVLQIFDATAMGLPVNDLQKFLYATIGTFICHFVVSLMLKFSQPHMFNYLYNLMDYDLYAVNPELKSESIKSELRCLRLKYSLLYFACYVATWLIVLATY